MHDTVSAPQPTSVVVQTRIQWVDTDASGHYHFATAFRLFEQAEAALLTGLGLDLYGRLPRAHASADYRRVLHFNDLVDVHAVVQAVGDSSIRYGFEVHHDGELCVEGTIVAVQLDVAEGTKVGFTAQEKERLLGGGALAPQLLSSGAA